MRHYFFASRANVAPLSRHNDLIVLRDPTTRKLDIQRQSPPPQHLTECPYCHQTIRGTSQSSPHNNGLASAQDDNSSSGPGREDRRGSFVDPEYWALLHQENRARQGEGGGRDSPGLLGRHSPIRRLTQPFVDGVVRALSPGREDDTDQEQGGDGSYSIPTYTDGSENEGEADSTGVQSLHTSSRPSTRPVSRAESEAHEDTRPVVQRHTSSDKAGIKRSAFSPGYFANFFHTERQLGSGGKGVVLLVRHELDGVRSEERRVGKECPV